MSHRPHPKPYDDVLQTIGWTPLIRLNRVTDGARTPVYLKAESFNPGGSVKDRIGVALIEAAENEGQLRPGGTIVEGTSGNTGIGLAVVAAVKGYRCVFTIPDKMSDEKVRLLRAFGAEVIVTPTVDPDHPEYYATVARRIADETPNSFLADQFYNPVNPEAHYRTTGPEIWEQTDGKITHFVASAGTGGTLSGVGRYLKEQNPGVQTIGVDPYGSVYYSYFNTREFDEDEIYPYLTEGVGEDILAGNMDFDLVDDYVRVTDKDAMLMTRRLA
ncbi:MAG: cysteine synthase family protein, partial [Gemmatimonadetes bacterium]|nr:cysteine synthase family protein [Gemmatimonadota bacterium]